VFPSRRWPIAFAHRGASAYAKENTLDAFRLALRMGATGLESDVWLAADGVPVLVHDRMARVGDRRVDVTRRTSPELATYGIPTLDALYRLLPEPVDLSLDVQHPDVAAPVLRCVAANEASSRLWLCSPDRSLLASLRASDDDVRLVWSTRPRRVDGGVVPALAGLPGLGVDVVNMHWRDWSPELVAAVHELGLRAFGWDAQTAAAIELLLDLRVDAIYSDWPDRLVAAIDSRSAPSNVPS
jgi:glycerophosphoryl diester phosphodiesterase